MRPDRIVVGVEDERATRLMRALYSPFQRNHERALITDVRSAELIKYAANAMLATRISFMNELANLADVLGADIEMVRRGIGSDSRIGYDFLYSGCGYGGSCFPKDVRALIRTAEGDAGITLKVLTAVEAANEAQKHVLTRKIKARFGNLKGRRFALWGLAFKPNTDDMRKAPSIEVAADLAAEGAAIAAYDPAAMPNARRVLAGLSSLEFADSAMAALDGADALIIVTEWKEFRSPDFDAVRRSLKQPVIFDGRNLYDPATVRGQGFEYFAIGR
jgi:UDPglucose 6-dehydrogenase